MRFMNDYDLIVARQRFEGHPFDQKGTPNRLHLVEVVDRLRDWTDNDSGSDGWAYWPAPARAAAKAMELVASTTNAANALQERYDATDAEVTAALRPIKAFCTRQMGHPARMTSDQRDWILGRSA